ncbi:YkvA family protein [Pseudomonas huanghezhanensis]|uniref:YkvA family protein n=1 Tax=Pseudomonas huanghezhanensis TaxID=3002903 RepID=UPI00228585C2|nr:YkvA family protein [Pseudomonas sp. BSw22131]
MFANTLKTLKAWARRLKANLILLWVCCRQPDIPWLPKTVALVTVAYALSPIDLIPDFIPLLGYLDDVILLPLGIALAMRSIPAPLLARCRPQAETMAGQRLSLKGRWIMAALFVLIWLALAWAVAEAVWRR